MFYHSIRGNLENRGEFHEEALSHGGERGHLSGFSDSRIIRSLKVHDRSITKSIMQRDSAPHKMKWAASGPQLWYIQEHGGMLGRGRCHFVGNLPRTKSGLFCLRHPNKSSLTHHAWDVRNFRRKPRRPPVDRALWEPRRKVLCTLCILPVAGSMSIRRS